MNNPLISLTKFALAVAIMSSTLAAQAATNYFLTPSFRGLAGTESAYWETFTSAYNGANSPNGLPLGGGTLANATITQTASPSAFLTGSGNIYDFSAPTGFTLNESVGFNIGQVIFQTRTAGSVLDYNSVLLTYDLGSGPATLLGTRTGLTDLAGGDSSLWSWDLSSLGNVNSFSIGFNASASSLSFDAGVLDVASVTAVPEPGVLSLAGCGVAVFLFVSRVRGANARVNT